MNLLLFTCSEICLLEGRSNVVSLINIIEEFSVPAFPVLVPRLAVSGIIEKEEDEPQAAELQIRILIDEDVLAERNFDINFQGLKRVRSLTELQGLPIPHAGILKFILSHADRELGRWNVNVNLIQQVAANAHPPAAAP
jgi:hypothetical protein